MPGREILTGEHGPDFNYDQQETLVVELWYPRLSKDLDPSQPRYKAQFVEVGLVDVRAADNVRISYDFQRNGWRIEQAQVHQWDSEDKVCDPLWKEVAFVQAWQASSEYEEVLTRKLNEEYSNGNS